MNANSSLDVGCAGRLPRLPPLPASQKPSDLYEIYLHNSQYPPLLQDHSWTLAIPYKELQHHRRPSESIGNNYSPRGQNLKIQHLQHRHHSLQCPPVAHHVDSPVVRKRQPATQSTPVIHKSHPLSLNQQLEIMRREETQSQRKQTEPTERDLDRYVYYITEGVYGHMLTPQPPEQITAILKLLPSRFQGDERKMQEDLLEEVQRNYEFNLRRSIVDYILLDPAERERLSISAVPRPFPSRVIRAPVPWFEIYREAHRRRTSAPSTL